MLEAFGQTQRQLLRSLFHAKSGLGSADLVKKLGVTRTAVHQHLAVLQADGFVEEGPALATGGRPGSSFRLTAKGIDLFPKQYTWFTELLLHSLENQDLEAWMKKLGKSVGASVASRTKELKGEERLREVVAIMNELLYEASLKKSAEGPRIQALNCVYHALAAKFPDICQFDLSLLGELAGGKVIHEKCILRGDNCCQFAFPKI